MSARALADEERRDFPRSTLWAPVEVHIPTAVRRGVIADLSRSGMRVEIERPPAVGTPALVRWDEQEAIGQVIWEKAASCGIRFDRPLAEGVIEEALVGARRGPVASVRNIQTGKRRRAPWEHGDENEAR